VYNTQSEGLLGESMDTTQTSTAADSELLANVFEERAENLSKRELSDWTTETPRDREILSKLKGPGAKLLSGPRGSGKSTLLRKAYYDLLDSQLVLAAYVNYARSLALEPLFHKRANAHELFRQWVLHKIVSGVAESFTELNRKLPQGLGAVAERAKFLIHALETSEEAPRVERPIAPSELLLLLERWTKESGFKRCVLLLDDAAHAFSPEQQREFFEIFRELRSRIVSAKAAVYPGITTYSPHFHVGHEAELVQAWYAPDDPSYLAVMRSLAERRLPPEMFRRLAGREDLIDYLALSSFGLPRGFLVMLSQLLGIEEDEGSRPTSQGAEQAVKTYVASVRGIFSTLSSKLPRYKNFIDIGHEFETAILRQLRQFNTNAPTNKKAVVFGVAEPVERELERILAFQEYAGMVRRLDSVSRGVKGVFQRYYLNYGILVVENALSLGKSYSLKSVVQALERRDAHAFIRTKAASLLGSDFRNRCSLDLAPCPTCGTPRLSEDARFCMKCGSRLVDTSIYDQLLQTEIDKLPLTRRKIEGLIRHTSIRTVQDILLDHEGRQIRSVPYIGHVWAARIRNAAEEFVSV